MTTCEAWRWVAHHWAYGMLRFVVLGAGMVSTVVKPARPTQRDSGSIPDGSTCMRLG